LKLKFWAELDRVVSAHNNTRVILASSTSNLPASSFTADLRHRAQCLVAHPVNPPFAIPLVELVKSPYTDPQVVVRARAIMKQIGQSPIVLKKEVDGFCLNRLQYALLAEAYRLVEDGICDPEDVDTAVSDGLGCRWAFMGPFQTIDLNAPGGVVDYCNRYTEGILRVVKTEDNSREWKPQVIQKIHEAMRAQVPMERMPERLEWRNRRLMQLAVHNRQMAAQSPASSSTQATGGMRSKL